MRRFSSIGWRRVALVSSAAVLISVLSGCYERVVNAPDTYQGEVYEPNLEEAGDEDRDKRRY